MSKVAVDTKVSFDEDFDQIAWLTRISQVMSLKRGE